MRIKAAVYDPPRPDFPFLGVVILPDGHVEAFAADSASEAQEFVNAAAARLAQATAEEK